MVHLARSQTEKGNPIVQIERQDMRMNIKQNPPMNQSKYTRRIARAVRSGFAVVLIPAMSIGTAIAQCWVNYSSISNPCNGPIRQFVCNCSMSGHGSCCCHIYWDQILYPEVCESAGSGYLTCEVAVVPIEVSCTQRHMRKDFFWEDCYYTTSTIYPAGTVYCDRTTVSGVCNAG